MDSNHDKVIQSHLCYRYTTRQYNSLITSELRRYPTSVPEIVDDLHGVFQSQSLQEILPSASPDTASKEGQVE